MCAVRGGREGRVCCKGGAEEPACACACACVCVCGGGGRACVVRDVVVGDVEGPTSHSHVGHAWEGR